MTASDLKVFEYVYHNDDSSIMQPGVILAKTLDDARCKVARLIPDDVDFDTITIVVKAF